MGGRGREEHDIPTEVQDETLHWVTTEVPKKPVNPFP